MGIEAVVSMSVPAAEAMARRGAGRGHRDRRGSAGGDDRRGQRRGSRSRLGLLGDSHLGGLLDRRLVVGRQGRGGIHAGDHLPAGIGAGQGVVEQLHHPVVARAGAGAAHHDRYDVVAFMLDAGQQVEARGCGIAGLDAIHALDPTEHAVVAGNGDAAIDEAAGGEIRVIAREALLDGAAESGEVARRRHLLRIGQAIRILEGGARHAERAGAQRHLPREAGGIAGNVLGDDHGDVIGRARDQCLDGVFDGDGRARLDAELGRLLRCGIGRNAQLGAERHTPLLQLLEQHVERHDLGDGGRVAQGVGIVLVQDLAGIGVDDDVGISALPHAAGGDRAGHDRFVARLLLLFRRGIRNARAEQRNCQQRHARSRQTSANDHRNPHLIRPAIWFRFEPEPVNPARAQQRGRPWPPAP
ncbi:hypothetical protein FHS55_001726 [Angulomicrobium tetraedrale]|uniref:Uncharacterized protein n=1 Tax=Ancylobacter tetraedralis TaxID=217068 RepID=A0A839Z9J6_9HYPH|nr:hypothetical protein [Ancylobacter tetraedralis]